jgi:hypothetical protein
MHDRFVLPHPGAVVSTPHGPVLAALDARITRSTGMLIILLMMRAASFASEVSPVRFCRIQCAWRSRVWLHLVTICAIARCGFVLDGASAAEVARELDMTEGAAVQAKFRILKRLREEVGELLD